MDTVQPIKRQRPGFALADDVRSWVLFHCSPGDYFGDPGHAFEVALRTLRGEEQAVRGECDRQGIPFNPNTFWGLYLELRQASAPLKPGPPTKDQGEKRQRLWGSVAEDFLEWADDQARSNRFHSPSQLVEVGFRRLMQLESSGVLRPTGALASRWKDYKAATA